MDFKRKENRKIRLKGKISNLPWQHLINPIPPFSQIYYFDLENGNQIVIYSKEHIECEKELEIIGKVVKVVGQSKRPGDNKEYIEYQLLVDNWKCIDS